MLILMFAAAAALAGPLAPAAEGKLECDSPDVARKTCQGLIRYFVAENGTVMAEERVLLVSDKRIIMEATDPVVIRGEAACGVLSEASLDKVAITVEGEPAEERLAIDMRDFFKILVKDFFGKEVCTTYAPGPRGSIATSRVEGVPEFDSKEEILWVAPDDGYSLGGAGMLDEMRAEMEADGGEPEDEAETPKIS